MDGLGLSHTDIIDGCGAVIPESEAIGGIWTFGSARIYPILRRHVIFWGEIGTIDQVFT
jgi:hypothetical protein